MAVPLEDITAFSVRKFDWVPVITLTVLTAGLVVQAGGNRGCCQ
jgi:hypothetical protein